jgi:hypothetical protein
MLYFLLGSASPGVPQIGPKQRRATLLHSNDRTRGALGVMDGWAAWAVVLAARLKYSPMRCVECRDPRQALASDTPVDQRPPELPRVSVCLLAGKPKQKPPRANPPRPYPSQPFIVHRGFPPQASSSIINSSLLTCLPICLLFVALVCVFGLHHFCS